MFNLRKLDEISSNMKSLGEFLVPYNYPQDLTSLFEGDDLELFKERNIYVDGYSLHLHYQKADYYSYFLETLQISNEHGSFLPFNIVKKVGIEFFGEKGLVLMEFFKKNVKIYCWALQKNKSGEIINNFSEKNKYEICQHENFNYFYVIPSYYSY